MAESYFQVSDVELVAACLAGKAAAWDELVRRYSNLVYAIVWKYQRQWNLPADIVPDIYQKVWVKILQPEKMAQISDARKLQTWIGVITAGECIDYMRALKRRQAYQPEPPVEIDDVRQRALVRIALDRLSHAKCRQLIQAIYYRGLTHKEAAEEMEMPLGSVSKMLRDNFAELHGWLGGIGFFEE